MQKNPAFKNFLFNMQQDGLIDVIELNPLNLEGTKSLIDHIISIDDVPDRFVKIVHVKSCGNPLFIKEMACHLLNQEGDDFSIPPSLSGVIEHRFEDLSGRSKHLMEVGAVIGEKVDFDIVEAVIDIEESELLDEIDILLEKKLWKEDEDGTLRFAHPLFREVVYRSISGLKRKKYHEKIAEAIKSVRDDVIYRYYLDIALHYERAGIFSSAFLNYEKAGIDAEKLGAYRVASDCYDRALKLDLSLRSEEFRKEKERVSTSKEELKRLIEHQ